MLSVIALLIGFAVGGGAVFALTLESRRRLSVRQREVVAAQQALKQQNADFQQRQSQLNQAISSYKHKVASYQTVLDDRAQQGQARLDEQLRQRQAQFDADMNDRQQELSRRQEALDRREFAFNQRCMTLADLEQENTLLKRDLRNIDVNLHKLELDRDRDRARQDEIERKVEEMAARYLKDNVKSVGSSINANNYVNCKQRLVKVIEQCRAIGFEIPSAQETELLGDLKGEFERAVKAQLEREEQVRIKARLREEQQLQKEIDQEMKRLEREREVVKAALEKALADAQQRHTDEVERLEARLADAEAKIQRAVSQAQLTRSGHVYVISNIGSFGENVYKIGMTRRLEPQDRVHELGDASVPFPFDVHMMVYSEDAPSLETALHRALQKNQVNKLNPRKEFYRTPLDSILEIVRANHGEVEYRADPEALQYRQSLVATDEDLQVVEAAWDDHQDVG